MKYSSEFLDKINAESYVSPKVMRKDTPGKGVGLFAKEKIFKNEIVSISGGVVLDTREWKELISTFDYAYNIADNLVIAPLNPEDPSDDWRMNHCCEPNCGVRGQTMFVAIRDIEPDEELTFDYAMTETDPEYKIELNCSRSTCRKKFTGEDWKKPEIQKKYKGYFSTYIEDKIQG
ncbi:MAG: SET domain-containing protein-lysine N-methyltransferase [Leptospiraceae bacterium]|nr:SET domain-containing protein-lysine N-methyltransferase [Leptospiraceae bacterium]